MRILSSAHDRRASFALRLRAYAQYLEGSEVPADGQYTDRLDDLDTTLAIGAFDRDRLVGSMRLCFSRPMDALSTLPCAPYYPELKAVKAAAPGALMEVSRVAIEPGIKNTSYRTTAYASFVRMALITAEAAHVSTILIATPAASERFYRYMLGFERIGQPAFYPPGDFKISLLAGDISQARGRQKLQNTFFRISSDEVMSMRNALSHLLRVPAVA